MSMTRDEINNFSYTIEKLKSEIDRQKALIEVGTIKYDAKKKECDELVSSMWKMSQDILKHEANKTFLIQKLTEIQHLAKTYEPVCCRMIIQKCEEGMNKLNGQMGS